MDDKELEYVTRRIVDVNLELVELGIRQGRLYAEHEASIHEQVAAILHNPTTGARFVFRDKRTPVEGWVQGNGTQACWVRLFDERDVDAPAERRRRVDYINVDHVDPL